jgi:branched-subunit amino acid transport protein
MDFMTFLPYLIVMAGVTYLIRVIPLVLFKHKIKNQFINSFLYYIPYTVLSAMTFPAILYATGSKISAIAGFITALLLAYRKKSLIMVAAGACGAVLIVEAAMYFL